MSKEHQFRAWRTLSAKILLQRPICQDPFGWHAKTGQITPATEVHHIQPVEQFPEMLLAVDNLLALCPTCHKAIHKSLEAIDTIAKSGVPLCRIIEIIASGGASPSPHKVKGVGGVLTFFSPSDTAPRKRAENAQCFEKGGTPPCSK